jgi:hypothetical protein
MSERFIRQHQNQLLNKSIKSKLIVKIFSSVCNVFNTQTMLSHCTSPINNHKNELIKTVITIYIKVRLHYEANKFNFKRVSLRQKYNKLTLFKSQYVLFLYE